MNICRVDTCEKTPKHRGWCSAHYQRWLKYGDAEHQSQNFGGVDGTLDESGLLNRVLANLTLDIDCWMWQGARNADGYGSLQQGNVRYSTHRYVYQTLVGEI